MENESFCDSIRIPARLHKNGRDVDQTFLPEENINRWFPPFNKDNESYILTNPETQEKIVSASVFRTDRMSCVREKHTEELNDALYNILSQDHYFNYGIVQLKVKDIESITFDHPVTKNTKYTLKVVHRPEDCLYPHVEIFTFENGEAKSDIKPSSIKTKVKQEYAKRCKIVKEPS